MTWDLEAFLFHSISWGQFQPNCFHCTHAAAADNAAVCCTT